MVEEKKTIDVTLDWKVLMMQDHSLRAISTLLLMRAFHFMRLSKITPMSLVVFYTIKEEYIVI